MKNKSYSLIWIAYALVVVFILVINNVFSFGVEKSRMEILNIVLNLVFLLIIGIIFAISTRSFIALNKLTSALSRVDELLKKEDRDSYDMNSNALWTTLNDSKTHFGNRYLDKAMDEYRAQLKRSGNGFASARIVPIDDFVNETLIEKVGMSHFNSIIPGTLTGLGILGTFIGLSLGLASFSGDDIYTISDNVGPLLSGMKVAFHTSVYGIFFSLIYTFIYRSIMSDAFEKLDAFLTTFKHYTNLAPSESEATTAMLVYQSNTASLLKEILAYMRGNSREQTASMDEIVNRFCQQMSYTLNTDFKTLGSTLKDVNDSQRGSAEMFRHLADTTNTLIEGNRQMMAALDELSKRQIELENRLEYQQQELDMAVSDLAAKLYTVNLADAYTSSGSDDDYED